MKRNQHEIQPYEKDQDNQRWRPPDSSPAPAAVNSGPGLFGCIWRVVAVLALVAVMVAVIFVGGSLLGIRETGNATRGFVDAINDLFGGGDNVTTFETGPILQMLEQEAWLESLRQTDIFEVQASNDMPGILPGKRTVEFGAFVTITAGIDLELLGPQHITQDGNNLTVTLPNAQVKDCILDLQNSQVEGKSCDVLGIGIGCGGLEDEVQPAALRLAMEQDFDVVLTKAFNDAARTIKDMIEAVSPDARVNIVRGSEPNALVAQNGTCAPYAPTPAPTGTPVG